MKIYRCIDTDYKVQGFGENLACALANEERLARPIRVIRGLFPNACPAGYIKLYPAIGLPKGHNGIDSLCYRGENVYNAIDFETCGGWMKTEVDLDGGVGVDVASDEPVLKCTEPNCDETHYVKFRVWHLLKPIGYDRKSVKLGELIGLGDSTGASSGDHVHWSPKWCDKDGAGMHTDNGFYGAFDPTPYFENIFVLRKVLPEPEAQKPIVETLTSEQILRKLIVSFQIWLQLIIKGLA